MKRTFLRISVFAIFILLFTGFSAQAQKQPLRADSLTVGGNPVTKFLKDYIVANKLTSSGITAEAILTAALADSNITLPKLSATVNAALGGFGTGTYGPDDLTLEFALPDSILQIKASGLTVAHLSSALADYIAGDSTWVSINVDSANLEAVIIGTNGTKIDSAKQIGDDLLFYAGGVAYRAYKDSTWETITATTANLTNINSTTTTATNLIATNFTIKSATWDTTGLTDGYVLAYQVSSNKWIPLSPSWGAASGGTGYADSLRGTAFQHDVDKFMNSSRHLTTETLAGALDSLDEVLSTHNWVKNSNMQHGTSFYRGQDNRAVADADFYDQQRGNVYSSHALGNNHNDHAVGQMITFVPEPSEFSVHFYIYPIDSLEGGAQGGVKVYAYYSGGDSTAHLRVGPNVEDVTEDAWNHYIVENLNYEATWDSIYVQFGISTFNTGNDSFVVGAMGVYAGPRAPDSLIYRTHFLDFLTDDDELEVDSNENIAIADSSVNWSDLDSLVHNRIWEDVRLNLPDSLLCVPGIEYNIYYNNIIFPSRDNYRFWVKRDSLDTNDRIRSAYIGDVLTHGWRWTPTIDDTLFSGTDALYWGVNVMKPWAWQYASDAHLVAKDTIIMVVVDSTFANQDTVLIIGDSFANVVIGADTAGKFVVPLKNLCGDSIIFIGTQESGSDYANEGHSGKNYGWIAADAASPFTDGGDNFDISTYLSNNGFDNPDIVLLTLSGHNDIGQKLPWTLELGSLASIMASIDTIITDIRADLPNAQIGLCLTAIPGDDEDPAATVPTYGKTQWIRRYNLDKVREKMLEYYDVGGSKYDAMVTIIPWQLNLDTANGFPTTTTAYNTHNSDTYTVQSDIIHPDSSGWLQLADIVYSWIIHKNNQ